MTSSLLLPDTPEYKKAQRQYLKATKNRPQNIDHEWSPFRAAEKRFKTRFPSPDLSSVLDLACADDARAGEIERGRWKGSPSAVKSVKIPLNAGNTYAYTIPSIPGLVILPSFISHQKQRDLVQWSLARHARQPNDTNLDIHYVLPEQGLWNSWLEAEIDPQKDFLVQPKASGSEPTHTAPTGPRQLVNNDPASPETFQAISTTPKPPPAPSPTVQPTRVSSLLYKLRWANIGWFYHWGTKQYDFTKGRGIIDDELRTVCIDAVRSVDWGNVHGSHCADWGPGGPDWESWEQTYEPDAGIVNFYQEKDTLMAHVDRSEVCATSPLVSISLGNAAAFLIGGLTRDTEPTPILLRSGDVVIMSGPACRRAYHGVPRILEGSLPLHLKADGLDDMEASTEWKPYEEYLSTSRINVNVRQKSDLNKVNCTVYQKLSHALNFYWSLYHRRPRKAFKVKMENDAGVLVDLYVPRKCSATNRLITSKDHASVQISIADVDANGRALNTTTTFALCGQVRSQGESDDSINRLATKAGLLRNVWSFQK
ncbi:hypothetical protein GALMADRAFT_89623 [Galerina marginata CBS 339.88]|uniref:Fe2OG dioxygenase domain-containing protein n=1 Tax=Galerina marginata (strain CBS 339.88) TaxID=685588 RepID=A0A067TEB8_GALM3|nr:hypothetical protein GALMADRAFT_89623 [Galerina marginata CBS 339.88]